MRESRSRYALNPPTLPFGPKGFPVYDPWELFQFFHSISHNGYVYYGEWGKVHLTSIDGVRLTLPFHGPWNKESIPPFSWYNVVQSDFPICTSLNYSNAWSISNFRYSRYFSNVDYSSGIRDYSDIQIIVSANHPFFQFFHPSVPLKYMCKKCLKVAPEMGQLQPTLF